MSSAFRIFLRVDGSTKIGTGHVMRCLTLASAFRERGGECTFICRVQPGHLIDFIRTSGYEVHVLPEPKGGVAFRTAVEVEIQPSPAHADWLGVSQVEDAEASITGMNGRIADWMIVDHYALDVQWEKKLAPHCRKMLVIDDLADRPHYCDALLDQTYGRSQDDYRYLVPFQCVLLCGSGYALLRPEFSLLRIYSIARRRQGNFKQLLIAMGGVDKDNTTGRVLRALRECKLPLDCRITVVVGAAAPGLTDVHIAAKQMRWPTTVLTAVKDVASLMAESDLAIGAAGATSWERCCLGLPTILVVLADNQLYVAAQLDKAGAARVLQDPKKIDVDLVGEVNALLQSPIERAEMSRRAAALTDGRGVNNVLESLGF